MDDQGQGVLRSWQKLVEEREPLNRQWSDAFRFTYPFRGKGFLNTGVDGITNANNASQDAAVLFDSTATDSVRLLASSVLSALTPPSSQWFSLALSNVGDDDIPRDGKEWLESAASRIFENIHSSNYDAQALEFFTDQMVGGMLGLYVEKRNGKYFFEVWPLATLYCQDTLGSGTIDTIYRRCPYTAAEAITKFKDVPDFIKDEYEKDNYSSKQFNFIHAIRPRMKNGRQVRGRLKSQMPWQSIYVCEKSGTVVQDSGYHEMPVVVPRWMRIPDTDYAFGPVSDTLPDIKTLNKITEYMLANAEMAISGMFVAKDDGVFNPNTARIGARRIWMVSDPANVKPLSSGGDIGFAVNEIARLQGQVRRTLLADQLGPSEKANQTATEIQTRTNLIRQILGPIFSRLNAEFLVPLIHRCFFLALREGDLGQPPDSIKGQLFNVVFKSPLARAMKQQELQAIDQFEARLGQKAAIKPEVLDLYDWDMSVTETADALGIDIKLMRDEMDVKKIREQRAQQQQAQAAAEAAAQAQPTQPPTKEEINEQVAQ